MGFYKTPESRPSRSSDADVLSAGAERPQWSLGQPHRLFERLAPQPVVSDELMHEFADRARELVALRVAVVRDCAYIWVAHTHIAAHLGLTVDEIAAVRHGASAFDGHDAATLQLVDDVLARRAASATTRLALGANDVLSVTIAAGFYDLVATIMDGAEPEPGVAAICGLETPAGARGGVPRAGGVSMRVNAATRNRCDRCAGELTIAERQDELITRLAELCARPARWHGALDPCTPRTCAFFLISAASVAWVEALAASAQIRMLDVSIEALGMFAAIEASIAIGRPQIVVCGAGPGIAGQLRAVPAGRAQGASVLALAPRTPRHLRAHDIQEVSAHQPVHLAGPDYYDEVICMEDVAQMPRIALRLRHLFTRTCALPRRATTAGCATATATLSPSSRSRTECCRAVHVPYHELVALRDACAKLGIVSGALGGTNANHSVRRGRGESFDAFLHAAGIGASTLVGDDAMLYCPDGHVCVWPRHRHFGASPAREMWLATARATATPTVTGRMRRSGGGYSCVRAYANTKYAPCGSPNPVGRLSAPTTSACSTRGVSRTWTLRKLARTT